MSGIEVLLFKGLRKPPSSLRKPSSLKLVSFKLVSKWDVDKRALGVDGCVVRDMVGRRDVGVGRCVLIRHGVD